MKITDFDYELPVELIAQAPLEERDASRMLVLNRREEEWVDSSFKEFARHLRPNDVVVLNNSRVIPARLLGQREGSGGQVGGTRRLQSSVGPLRVGAHRWERRLPRVGEVGVPFHGPTGDCGPRS